MEKHKMFFRFGVGILFAVSYVGMSPAAFGQDSDGDLLSDDVEIACGSDPNDFTSRCDGFCGLPLIDVWDSTDPNNFVLVGQIHTIQTAQTGKQHYNYFSASGHPTCVNLGGQTANTWMHKNTGTGDLTFGFEFSKQGGGFNNTAQLNFRLVNSVRIRAEIT